MFLHQQVHVPPHRVSTLLGLEWNLKNKIRRLPFYAFGIRTQKHFL